MIPFLLEPLQYAFMRHALLAATLVGVLCAVVGAFVVLRGMAFLGDALAHAVMPGVAAAYLVGGAQGPLLWGALGAALLTALGIGALTRGGRVREDTAIGVIFAGMLALGIALISATRSYAVDLTHILFGDVLSITLTDLWLIGGFGGGVLLLAAAFYKELVVVSFDPVHAATLRLPAEPLRYLLLAMVAVTVVVSLKTIGAGLMAAMLITPAATGYLLTKRLSRMMGLAALVAVGAGVTGLYLSYYLSVYQEVSIASGAAIVLATTACFAGAWIVQAVRQYWAGGR
jgi:ABC-type Mn2+/Zn2+ transport system permease subunit